MCPLSHPPGCGVSRQPYDRELLRGKVGAPDFLAELADNDPQLLRDGATGEWVHPDGAIPGSRSARSSMTLAMASRTPPS